MTKKANTTTQATEVTKATINTAAAQATATPSTEITKAQRRMYDLVKSNVTKVGGKSYAYVPVELLFADYRYQRFTPKGANKVRNLVSKWNPAKMDALRVSLHDEECKIAVINGMHRLIAAIIKEIDVIECEIVTGLPQTPEERLKAEAYIFVTQNDEIDLLKPHQKHNAGVLIGAKEYIALDNVVKRHGVTFKKNSGARGKCKVGVLSGYTRALNIARIYGEERLDNIFSVICESRWNMSSNGFSNDVLVCINNVLRFHPEKTQEIMPICVELMKPITPNQFIAESFTAYPERTETERATLYLEDYVCDKLGLSRLYMADKHITRKTAATITPLTVVPDTGNTPSAVAL